MAQKNRERIHRGSVGKKHGAWIWRYYENGKQKSVKLARVDDRCSTEQDAIRMANARNARLFDANRDPLAPSAALTLSAFWTDVYLPHLEERLAHNDLRPATLDGYKKLWRKTIEPEIGQHVLGEYRPRFATEFLTALVRKGYGRHALNHTRALMSAVFSHAVTLEYVLANPVSGAQSLIKPRKPKETDHYTAEEFGGMLRALDSDEHARDHAIICLCLVGLRRAEISGLKWGDLDFKKHTLVVKRSAWQGKVNDDGETKTSVGRKVTLGGDNYIVDSLKRWQKLNEVKSDFVFANEAGNPLDLGLYSTRVLAPKFKALKLKWKGYYAGRRGSATLMNRETNGNSQIVAHHFGHSKEVEDRFYVKPVPEDTKKAADAVFATVAALASRDNEGQSAQ